MEKTSVQSVYRIPLALDLITIVDLLSALLGDGIWDAFSWLLLAIPPLLLGFLVCRRSPARGQARSFHWRSS